MKKQVTDTAVVQEFIEAARRFCDLIEHRQTYSTVELLQLVYVTLPELCLKGMMLPVIEQSDFFAERQSSDEWSTTYKSLREFLGEHNGYLIQFDPWDFDDKEPVCAHLADDISSVYCQMVAGLNAWEKADAKKRRDIADTWRVMYEIYWGDYATRAFRVIHSLLYDHIDDEDGVPIGIRNNQSFRHMEKDKID